MPMLTQFTVKLIKGQEKGSWTYVLMPNSVEFFGTRGLVKITGTIDKYPFASSLMPMGDGTHMLPVKAEIRKAIAKDDGDPVTVFIETAHIGGMKKVA